MASRELVGRTSAIERLMGALAAAVEGAPTHVLVSGEAGVGKTRLLSRSRELAEADGARVLLGGCISMGEAGLPFAPYTEILRSLVAQDGAARIAALAGRASSDLARLLPALGPEETAPSQEFWAQTRMYEAILDLLRQLAERSPIVVQLEDLHWADAGTLAATSFLLRAIRDEPITLVGTLRADEVARDHPLRAWLAEVGRSGNLERLELDPLDEAEVAALVRDITGEEPDSATIADFYRRSDGNPFFIEELLASHVEGGQQLPSSLRDVLLARVDILDAPSRQLLGVAAIGGRDVPHDVLVAVAGTAEQESRANIRSLVDAGLLVPTATAALDGYAFRHSLLQEAIYEGMLPTERRELHRAYAEELARDVPASPATGPLVELAHHWREARDPRALDASIRAADAAMGSSAYDAALVEYEAALALWSDDGGGPAIELDHIELLRRTGQAAYLASKFARAVSAHQAALAALGDSDDAARRSEMQVLLGRAYWVAGDWDGSIAAYEEALKVAPSEPPIARIRALAGLGQTCMLFGWFDRARPLCEQAIELARSVGARDLESHALCTLSITLVQAGETEAAVEAIGTAVDIAEELDLADDIGRGYVQFSDVYALIGYMDRALETARRGIKVVVERGMDSSYGTYLRFNAVSFAYQSGAWDLAAELLADADRSAPDGPGIERYRAEYALGFLVNSGAPEATDTWLKTRAMMVESLPSASMGPAYMAGVAAAAFEGRYADAVEIAFEGLERLEQHGVTTFTVHLAQIAAWPVAELGAGAHQTNDDEAAALARERIDRLGRMTQTVRDSLALSAGRMALVLDLEAEQIEVESARIDGRDTAERWQGLSASWSEIGRPYEALYARWREAQALETAGDREAAVATVRETHQAAHRLGARPLAAELEVLARKLRIRLGATSSTAAPADHAAFGLTPREREVLSLVAKGRSNRQISDELFISESTAGVHVSNILSKLGVASRTEAASVALSQGLLET